MTEPREPSHEVSVLCTCPDIELCAMELYLADVRIAHAVIEYLLLERQYRERRGDRRDG
jgi:hypothetical protein